jgi:hypothetical protein
MAKDRDPAETIATIAQSIRVSECRARCVRAHRFKELFGYHALTAPRRERIEHLMTEVGLAARTGLAPRALDVNELRTELRRQAAFLHEP